MFLITSTHIQNYLNFVWHTYAKHSYNKCLPWVYSHSSLDVFLWVFLGILLTLAGWHLLWCSSITHFTLSNLFLIQEYVRVNSLISWWIDSIPCSPSKPTPVLYCLTQSTMWSSRKCILGIILALGKKWRYKAMNNCISSSAKQTNCRLSYICECTIQILWTLLFCSRMNVHSNKLW